MDKGTVEIAARQGSPPFSIAPVSLDDWSDVRHLHALTFEKLIASAIDAPGLEAFKATAASWEYMQDLQAAHLSGAYIDGFLAGTCGWLPADDTGSLARIAFHYVNPMFTRLGIGRQLLAHAEMQASAAGFRALTVRAPVTSVEFFAALGYEVGSYGVHNYETGAGLPVAFMRKLLPAR